MPWVRAELRGQQVYARASAAGSLEVEGGRVEIRYKPQDGRRYWARSDNLRVLEGSPLPDDACGPAETVVKADKAAEPAKGGGKPKRSKRGESRTDTPAPTAEGTIVVYADGACSGNPGPAGLGVVIIDGRERIEISEFLGEGTNNVAELTAVLRALHEVGGRHRPIVIHTDSQYTIGVVKKGWKAKANVDLVHELRKVIGQIDDAELRYVPGHAGVILNERADELAREAVKERTTRRAVFST